MLVIMCQAKVKSKSVMINVQEETLLKILFLLKLYFLYYLSSNRHPNIDKNGDVCISILHEPGDDKYGYEQASERWLPVHTVETILISVRFYKFSKFLGFASLCASNFFPDSVVFFVLVDRKASTVCLGCLYRTKLQGRMTISKRKNPLVTLDDIIWKVCSNYWQRASAGFLAKHCIMKTY